MFVWLLTAGVFVLGVITTPSGGPTTTVRAADPQIDVPLTAEIVSGPVVELPKYAVCVPTLVPKFSVNVDEAVPPDVAENDPLPTSLRTMEMAVGPGFFSGAPTEFSRVTVIWSFGDELSLGVTVLSAIPTCAAAGPPTVKLKVTGSAGE